MGRVYVPKTVTKIGENVFAVDCPIEPAEVIEGYSEEYDLYVEQQNGEQVDSSSQIDNFMPYPIGFLLGVEDEECEAAKYAREKGIPYAVVSDVEMFINAERKEKTEINNKNIEEFF